jgi:hypothetical protein
MSLFKKVVERGVVLELAKRNAREAKEALELEKVRKLFESDLARADKVIDASSEKKTDVHFEAVSAEVASILHHHYRNEGFYVKSNGGSFLHVTWDHAVELEIQRRLKKHD